jgi:hypothetical protein
MHTLHGEQVPPAPANGPGRSAPHGPAYALPVTPAPWHTRLPEWLLWLLGLGAPLVALLLWPALHHFFLAAGLGIANFLAERDETRADRWPLALKSLAAGLVLTPLCWWALPERLFYSGTRLAEYSLYDYSLVVNSLAILAYGALMTLYNAAEALLRPLGLMREREEEAMAQLAARERAARQGNAPAEEAQANPHAPPPELPATPGTAPFPQRRAIPPVDWRQSDATAHAPAGEDKRVLAAQGMAIALLFAGIFSFGLSFAGRHWLAGALFGAAAAAALYPYSNRGTRRQLAWACLCLGIVMVAMLAWFTPLQALLSFNALRQQGTGVPLDVAVAGGSLLSCGLCLLGWNALRRHWHQPRRNPVGPVDS